MKAAFKYLLFLTAIHVHRRFYICKRPRPPDCPECGRTNRGMQAICATARLPWAAASTGGCTKCSAAKYCQKCVNENLEQTVQNNNYEILIDRNSIGRLGTSKKKVIYCGKVALACCLSHLHWQKHLGLSHCHWLPALSVSLFAGIPPAKRT